MIADYFFNEGIKSPQKKQEMSGSFGIQSSQFSQKNNNSGHGSKKIEPSFFDQSSIRKFNNSESGEFIYFQNDSVLSELKLELKDKKDSEKQKQKNNNKSSLIHVSREISFEDSMQKSLNKHDSRINEYGTGRSNLPPTLKKPKFGFKVSQTAESSAIMNDVERSGVVNNFDEQYQIKVTKNISKKLKQSRSVQQGHQSGLKYSKKMRRQQQQHKRQESISSIKGPVRQPSIISKKLSESKQMSGSMNFKSAFKTKVQKASVIRSPLSKNNNYAKSSNSILSQQRQPCITKNEDSIFKESLINDKQVKIAQLKDLRQLENKLGQIKHQNKKIIEYIIEKDHQIQQLKIKKEQIQTEDPYAFIKENELIKAFLQPKAKKPSYDLKQDQNLAYQKCLHSANSLKQINLKKSSQISSLHDYDIKEHKFKVQPLPLTKAQKKFILSNRGLVLCQRYLDVGYSLKQNVLTIYLTLKKQYEEITVKLEQNSVILSSGIDRVFKDSGVGKQIKFKTEIKSTKCQNPSDQYFPLCFKVYLNSQQKFQNKVSQYKVQLPITVYNIAKQLDISQNLIQSLKTSKPSSRQCFKTQTLVACKELIRSPQDYLLKLFPRGCFLKEQNIFQVGFVWKQKKEIFRIRIKERSFVLEGDGNPNKCTFELLRSIVSLLIEQKQQI